MNKILDGVRVIEGAAFVAAPLCGMTLGQLGADVIRFDPIEGGLDARRWPITRDGRSLYWAGLNKGKRSIAVDARSPEGRELIAALITAPGEVGKFVRKIPPPSPGAVISAAMSSRPSGLRASTAIERLPLLRPAQ
ncbi:MAG: CoA transferase [Planctomycetaceae bacterium]|nr:CoA transferase [Planctomycetaceae bacterium]